MKTRRIIALAISFMLIAVIVIGCDNTPATTPDSGNQNQGGSSNQTATPAPSAPDEPAPIVTIKTTYPGDEPTRMPEVLAAINEKIGQDISVNLELTWAPWSDYATKIQLDIAAGVDIDYIWSGSSDLASFHAQRLIAPIDDLMVQYGGPIYDTIPLTFFDTMKIDGVLLGIPMTANSPISGVFHSMTFREDLRAKHNLPVPNTLDNMELFFSTIAEQEDNVWPLLSTNFGWTMLPLHGSEGFLGGTSGAAASRINPDGSVTIMPIQEAESWQRSGEKMREWYLNGWIPADILNMAPGDMFMQGLGGGTNGSALHAAENIGRITSNVPHAALGDARMLRTGGEKWLAGNGGNAFYLSATSSNPEAVIKFLSWVVTNQDNWDLYSHGILGEDYELTPNGRIRTLSDYNIFPDWMFKNTDFLRFDETITDEYINTIRTWDDGAQWSPLFGFVFNPAAVEIELAAFGAVWGQYTAAFDSGAGDRDIILPEFISQATAAGQMAIVEEAKRQVDEFLANR